VDERCKKIEIAFARAPANQSITGQIPFEIQIRRDAFWRWNMERRSTSPSDGEPLQRSK
jgi:hypothetical protein